MKATITLHLMNLADIEEIIKRLAEAEKNTSCEIEVRIEVSENYSFSTAMARTSVPPTE